jgi:hypothetical protein
MRRRKYPVTEGAIYAARAGHRRIVSCFEHEDLGTRIVYSIGGIGLRECGYERFRRWATAAGARPVGAGRRPTMRLAREGRA